MQPAGFWIKAEIFALLLVPFGVVAVAPAFDALVGYFANRSGLRIIAVTSRHLRWRVLPLPWTDAPWARD